MIDAAAVGGSHAQGNGKGQVAQNGRRHHAPDGPARALSSSHRAPGYCNVKLIGSWLYSLTNGNDADNETDALYKRTPCKQSTPSPCRHGTYCQSAVTWQR